MNSDTPALTVTILGSGTCVPSLKRSACAALLRIGKARILVDSGPGTLRRLLEAESSIFDLTHVCYTHLHPDHTGELVPLIFATKYPDINRRVKPLTICAGIGFNNFFSGLQQVYGDWIDLPPGMLHLVELDNTGPDRIDFDEFSVRTLPVEHNPESLAFRITDNYGRSVVISGDTDFSDNLITLAEGADLLICESALPDDQKITGHLTPSLAGRIATRAGVGKLVLTHFYPECEKADIRKQCRQAYSGPLVLAQDLMEFELTA
ncbi:MAG: MBL fold metallo-hydrolase [Deltaproteobacteria bacterium SG8_13]|nr:MAG: MBL fold metallo-hydrolase [Deltaproteobacteria bacterium SG8_13]